MLSFHYLATFKIFFVHDSSVFQQCIKVCHFFLDSLDSNLFKYLLTVFSLTSSEMPIKHMLHFLTLYFLLFGGSSILISVLT